MVLSMVGELPDTSNTVASIKAVAAERAAAAAEAGVPVPESDPATESPPLRRLRNRLRFRGWGVDRVLQTQVITVLTGEHYPIPGLDADQHQPPGPRPESTLSDFGI